MGRGMEACTAAPSSHSSLNRGVSSFSLNASAGTRLHRACARKRTCMAWKAAQGSISNSSSAGNVGKKNEQEGNMLEDVASLLGSCEQLKVIADSSSSSGVGTDMRNRVDHLLKRVRLLKQSAERAIRVAGGRVPSQLIASLKALQREQDSVENIVRLAIQAGPVLIEEGANNLENSGVAVIAQKGVLSVTHEADTANVELEQGEEYGAPVEVLSGPKYVMSTPSSEGSFKLTAVRAEIERRVMAQLLKKQGRFNSKQGFAQERQKLQEAPIVEQRSLGGGKIDVDNATQTRTGLLPQKDTHSTYNKQEADLKAEMENKRTISVELHEKMDVKFEKALCDLKDKLSNVTNDLREGENTLLALKEKLMNEQEKLLKKVDDLSGEVTKRLTGEQLSNTLGKVILDMEEDLKRIQSQLVTLGSDLNMKDKILAGWRDDQEKIRQELQAGILRLEGRLHKSEGMFEGFSPQSVLAELESVKATTAALQEGQSHEQSKLADWQAKVGLFESSLLSNAQQIKKLTAEVECKVEEGEVKDVLNKVLNEVEMQGKNLQERLGCVNDEHVKTASSLGLLQDKWKSHRKELQLQMDNVKDKLTFLETTQIQDVLSELSSIKNKLSELQEEQKHERLLKLEAQQQMFMSEGNEVEMQGKNLQERIQCVSDEQAKTASFLGFLQEEWKSHREELQLQLDDMKEKLTFLETTQNQGVLSQLSSIENKLSELQEEQKHERSLVLEAQQQMFMLEGKGLDLLKRMSEDAEVLKKDLLKEVRTLVDELLRNSSVRQSDNMQASVPLRESNDTVKDVGYLGNLVNSSSSSTLGSELSASVLKNDQDKVTTQEGAKQASDKGTASLEAFFSVMGHLIREELKKMDHTSGQTLPSTDLSHFGESNQGLGSNCLDKPNLSNTDGENQQQIIVLRYKSSWKRAFIHYCADNCGWTGVPGVPMQEASNSEGKFWKEFRIKAGRLEFVVTDGQGNWDRAPNGNNYLLEKPGIFDLGSGVLKAASPF